MYSNNYPLHAWPPPLRPPNANTGSSATHAGAGRASDGRRRSRPNFSGELFLLRRLGRGRLTKGDGARPHFYCRHFMAEMGGSGVSLVPSTLFLMSSCSFSFSLLHSLLSYYHFPFSFIYFPVFSASFFLSLPLPLSTTSWVSEKKDSSPKDADFRLRLRASTRTARGTLFLRHFNSVVSYLPFILYFVLILFFFLVR